MTAPLKSPFPWFGGKSRAAPLIWERFGDPANFVEPFAGSLAVLLGRPTPPRIETVNDLDCFVANFWRSLKSDPAGVTEWASDPVNEADLHARHLWLVNRDDFRERMKTDPDFFDVKVAGWWVWGQCSWIGSGWCRNAGMGVNRQLPHVGDAGRGVRLAAYLDRSRRGSTGCGSAAASGTGFSDPPSPSATARPPSCSTRRTPTRPVARASFTRRTTVRSPTRSASGPWPTATTPTEDRPVRLRGGARDAR
jgi:hypothetical protein